MTDLSQTVETKKRRWKEPTLLIGIGGVLATIIVGLVTYWLTAGRVSREKEPGVKATLYS